MGFPHPFDVLNSYTYHSLTDNELSDNKSQEEAENTFLTLQEKYLNNPNAESNEKALVNCEWRHSNNTTDTGNNVNQSISANGKSSEAYIDPQLRNESDGKISSAGRRKCEVTFEFSAKAKQKEKGMKRKRNLIIRIRFPKEPKLVPISSEKLNQLDFSNKKMRSERQVGPTKVNKSKVYLETETIIKKKKKFDLRAANDDHALAKHLHQFIGFHKTIDPSLVFENPPSLWSSQFNQFSQYSSFNVNPTDIIKSIYSEDIKDSQMTSFPLHKGVTHTVCTVEDVNNSSHPASIYQKALRFLHQQEDLYQLPDKTKWHQGKSVSINALVNNPDNLQSLDGKLLRESHVTSINREDDNDILDDKNLKGSNVQNELANNAQFSTHISELMIKRLYKEGSVKSITHYLQPEYQEYQFRLVDICLFDYINKSDLERLEAFFKSRALPL